MTDMHEDDVPLFGGHGPCGSGDDSLEYDEDGSLALARELADEIVATRTGRLATETLFDRPCLLSDLNGSWFLQLVPQGPHIPTQIRGPMRIEAVRPRLRISGDIYVSRPVLAPSLEVLQPIVTSPLLFRRNWYPQLPKGDYSWYFRSLGVVYNAGRLTFRFERHLWNQVTQEFASKDTGSMTFQCRNASIFNHPLLPQPTIKMSGTATIGGRTYSATATKTSPYYRGCAVEVDVMANRSFPLSATLVNGTVVSFASVYRASAGWDCAVRVDQTAIPTDAHLTDAELHAALSTHRTPATGDAWRFWLLVGSAQTGFGVMFDDIAPFREGAVGFFDERLPNLAKIAASARNQKLGDVADAFLRTLIHEAGHGFNLYHPKHDIHPNPVGTTIMNQTGDLLQFATPADTFPGNAVFAFDDHCRTSLIHSPDPQVAPGWKKFGWGHGNLSSGVPEPIDADGLTRDAPDDPDLTLELAIPENIFRGEFVTAGFVVTNNGDSPRAVTRAINLSEGDLRLLMTRPSGEMEDVRDVVMVCGPRDMVILGPGESIRGNAQIFFTTAGLTFRRTGRHVVSAELDVGDGSGAIVRSDAVTVIVRAPDTAAEEAVAQLAMSDNVGSAFALGDFGRDEEARARLDALAANHIESRTGTAAALTLANALGRDLRDLAGGGNHRSADTKAAKAMFERAAEAADGGEDLVRMATAVVAPNEADAPLIAMTEKQVGGAQEGPKRGRGRALTADSAGRDGGGALLDELRRSLAQRQ